jgi:hypothetical protein
MGSQVAELSVKSLQSRDIESHVFPSTHDTHEYAMKYGWEKRVARRVME